MRKYGEDGKVAMRNIRRDAMEEFKTMKKKASELTEDDREGPGEGTPGA